MSDRYDTSDLTGEMIFYYLARTERHKKMVFWYVLVLAEALGDDMKSLLIEDGLFHDASKYSPEEFAPYVRLTWWYKQNGPKAGKPPKSILGDAWDHHYTTNDHHPGFWLPDLSRMTTVAIAHMVADLAAMSVENQNGLYDWLETNTFVKFQWTDAQKTLILSFASVLLNKCPEIPARTPKAEDKKEEA
jgi:hypothetical protein